MTDTFKSAIKALPAPVNHEAYELSFYAGSQHMKIIGTDKATGTKFIAAKLCSPGADPLSRELCLGFAALALQAQAMLSFIKGIAATTSDELTKSIALDMIAKAERTAPTLGEVSPIVVQAAEAAKVAGVQLPQGFDEFLG